jgi:hypothetical protein
VWHAVAGARTFENAFDGLVHGVEELQTEDSRLAEVGFGVASDIIPRKADRLAAQNATGAPFDFCSPRRLDFRGIVGFRIIETRQQFGGDVCAVGDGQSERFTQKFLGPGRHDSFYIDSSASPERALASSCRAADALTVLRRESVRYKGRRVQRAGRASRISR